MKIELSNQEPRRKQRGIKPTCGIKEILLKEWKLKLLFSFCATVIFCTAYPLTGRYPLFNVTTVPIFFPDRIIPFIHQTVYVYESIWIFNAAVILVLISKKEILQYSAGITTIFLVCFLFFIFLPMSITLPEYGEKSGKLYKILREFDSPLNTFPSMHVALVFYNCLWYFPLYCKQRVRFPIVLGILVWGSAIIASTLTLKQHAVIDVISGIIVAYTAFIMQGESFFYKKIAKTLFFDNLLESGKIKTNIYAVKNICVNFYIIKTSKNSYICIDCGWDKESTKEALKKLQINSELVTTVFLTHHHWDHAGGIDLFPNATIYTENSSKLKKTKTEKYREIYNDKSIIIDEITITPITVPGHTSDSVAYFVNDRYLFTGDTLRIKNGKILPFYRIFNKNNRKTKRAMSTLIALNPKMILTAHSGTFMS